MDMQLIQERIANAAMELFASTCVLSRWDSELMAVGRNGSERADHIAADLFVQAVFPQIARFLRGLGTTTTRHACRPLMLSSAKSAAQEQWA